MNRFILCLFCAAALVSSCGVKSFGPDKPDVEENVSDTVKQLRRLAAMELIEERDSSANGMTVKKYKGGLLVERTNLYSRTDFKTGARIVYEYSDKTVITTNYSIDQDVERLSSVKTEVYLDDARTQLLSSEVASFDKNGNKRITEVWTCEFKDGKRVKTVIKYETYTATYIYEYTDELSYVQYVYQDDLLFLKNTHTETAAERSDELYALNPYTMDGFYKDSYTCEKWTDGSRKQRLNTVSRKWNTYGDQTSYIEFRYSYTGDFCTRKEQFSSEGLVYIEEYAYSEDGMVVTYDYYHYYRESSYPEHTHVDYVNDREFKLAEYVYSGTRSSGEGHLTWNDNSRTWTEYSYYLPSDSKLYISSTHTEIYR